MLAFLYKRILLYFFYRIEIIGLRTFQLSGLPYYFIVCIFIIFVSFTYFISVKIVFFQYEVNITIN